MYFVHAFWIQSFNLCLLAFSWNYTFTFQFNTTGNNLNSKISFLSELSTMLRRGRLPWDRRQDGCLQPWRPMNQPVPPGEVGPPSKAEPSGLERKVALLFMLLRLSPLIPPTVNWWTHVKPFGTLLHMFVVFGKQWSYWRSYAIFLWKRNKCNSSVRMMISDALTNLMRASPLDSLVVILRPVRVLRQQSGW